MFLKYIGFKSLIYLDEHSRLGTLAVSFLEECITIFIYSANFDTEIRYCFKTACIMT